MLLATSNPKKPCGISYSDKGDFTFQTQLWHHTGHLMVGLLPFNVSRMTRCDVHDNDNGPTHIPPPYCDTPTSHATVTCPHSPSHALTHSPHLAHHCHCCHCCMPSPLPSSLHALTHPPHFASCHRHHCMPLHTLSPLQTLTLNVLPPRMPSHLRTPSPLHTLLSLPSHAWADVEIGHRDPIGSSRWS